MSYCFNCFLLHTGVYFHFITPIALLIFDKYVNQIRTCVEMNKYGVLGNPTHTIVYIRDNIVQNGAVILFNLIKELEKMEDSHELTIKLKGMAMK